MERGTDAKPFTAVTSRPLVWVNILFGIVVCALALATVGLMIMAVALLFMEDNTPLWGRFALLCIALVMNGVLLYLILKGKRYTTITVDKDGVQFYNQYTKTIVKTLLWRSFSKDPAHAKDRYPSYDINKETTSGMVNGARVSADHFQWWYTQDGRAVRQREAFRGAHPFHVFFANRGELIAAFMKGLKQYRPDLSVDPTLFLTFFIDPNTYEHQRGKQTVTFVAGIALAVIIFAIIYYFVR
ncbi:hypothetical protein SAMN04488505_102688 [Chitinophaga rupis]|uniref:Uncharacterized protein n=1 Tax=Chitinophaga rupis TaxID=573321 RepID=A0A1H7RPK3_9BACT|nr:hypothetical protein [Chitinophaga rupis]SEL61744.1 hypothetical protein SAMN04488505_102688 [Chitinophaga rupis]